VLEELAVREGIEAGIPDLQPPHQVKVLEGEV